jgi:GNAT superfamily N-acetyltransferase
MPPDITAALLERAEAEAYYSFEAGAPPAAQAALGMRRLRIGGGVALAVPGDPTRFWSKVIGLGFDEPVTAGLLGRVTDFYRAQGMSRALIQVAPAQLPADWPELCADLGLAGGSALAKLAGDTGTVLARTADAKLDAGLRVGVAGRDQAAEWASVMLSVFGFPAGHQSDMAAAAVGRPGWHCFAVWDGPDIVATAGLHLHAGTGHLFGGATVPAARNRGAQSALIAARAQAARQAGCRWIIGETGREAPGEHSPSLHNMLRAGLTLRYERENWTWRDPDATH